MKTEQEIYQLAEEVWIAASTGEAALYTMYLKGYLEGVNEAKTIVEKARAQVGESAMGRVSDSRSKTMA